ncbi:hypothetical protein GCM10019059_42130 [Camelimonas fluminis]|nr:hypothetical protein GCM10019059_42130 [Camelimonas fluminis]
MDVGFSGPIEVTISSRYFLGSCEYESIRSHEFRHVDIMRKSVTAYRDEMAAVVASSVATLSEYTFTLPDAQRRILDHIQMSTRSVFDKMMRMSVEQNAALDTPENYRREQAVCSNW